MRRFLASVAILAAGLTGPIGMFACGDSSSSSAPESPDAAVRRDGGPVDPPDATPSDASPPPQPVPTCDKYCELVAKSCTGDQAQYASLDECLAFCGRFDQGKPGETDTSTLACRAFYAGSPAKTDPGKYCPAAGPWGGGLCGDRCNAFCQLAVSVCDPDAGTMAQAAPYPSYPDCATECAGYAYRDAGADGGGEGPGGPSSGDTLNCRLYELRKVLATTATCSAIAPDSGSCF